MMRLFLFAAAIAASYADASGKRQLSWGKPDISQVEFESGSHICAMQSARRDVTDNKSTKKYLRGYEVLERENNMPPMPMPDTDDPNEIRSRRQVLLRRAYQPDRHVDTLQRQLQREVEQCLLERGYVRFALTRDQERKLMRLRPGSELRRRYLFELGTDRRIIDAQRISN